MSSITFELTGLSANLNLFVVHPDLEALQQGGVGLRYSRKRGIDDKIVVVGPGLADYVLASQYDIEVSGQDCRASSPFALNVRVP